MSPSITLTAVATGIAVATGTAELVRGTADVISYMRDKRCRECSMMVKQREMVKHLEDHLDQNHLLCADEKAELESKIERMADAENKLKEEKADVEKRMKEQKEELLHKIETMEKDHKDEKKLLKAEKAALKEELLNAKNEVTQLKALASSDIKMKCEVCNRSVLTRYWDSHIQNHRNERSLLQKHLDGKFE